MYQCLFILNTKIIFHICSRSYWALCFFLLIHIYTGTNKFHILANNWQIKDVLYYRRWFRKTKSHIVQLGLGQSLTLKSLSITTTTTHNNTNFFKRSRLRRRLRFDMLRNWSPPLQFFYSPLLKFIFYPHPLFSAPPHPKKNYPHHTKRF